jgi:putative oxidoreductase
MNMMFTLGRTLLVAIFIVSGALKLIDIAGTADHIQSRLTIPSVFSDIVLSLQTTIGLSIWQILAISTGLVAVIASVLIAFNVLTRTMAVILLVYTAVTIFYEHDFWNMAAGVDRMNNNVQAMKNLSIMGGLLILAAWPRRAGKQEWDEAAPVVATGHNARES